MLTCDDRKLQSPEFIETMTECTIDSYCEELKHLILHNAMKEAYRKVFRHKTVF